MDSTDSDEASTHEDNERMTQYFKDAQDGLREADVEIRDFVKENPLLALAMAVAGGYLIGRVLTRR
jgi:ElaB/YqjD/DUF883 family membrane-anchored ribosome-binding protein